MKKLIVLNLFVIGLTGIFLFGKDSPNSFTLSKFKLDKENQNELSQLKNENKALVEKVLNLEKRNKVLLKMVNSKRNIEGIASASKLKKKQRDKIHKIKSGEDLMKISKIYYNTYRKWKLILRANPNVDSGGLKVGQEIIVPNIETEYVVWRNGKMIEKVKLKESIKRAPAFEKIDSNKSQTEN